MTPRTATKETHFILVYGSEAVLSLELTILTNRITSLDTIDNNIGLRINLDVSMDRREVEAIQKAHYKKQTENQYNQRVEGRSFKIGEHVLRNNEVSREEPQGKLRPIWEGLYLIQEVNRGGSYSLHTLEEETIQRSWHVKAQNEITTKTGRTTS